MAGALRRCCMLLSIPGVAALDKGEKTLRRLVYDVTAKKGSLLYDLNAEIGPNCVGLRVYCKRHQASVFRGPKSLMTV